MRRLLLGVLLGGAVVGTAPAAWKWVRRKSRTQVHRINQ
jgi:hypothetical protein